MCVINVGSRGEKMGVLQLEKERVRSRVSESEGERRRRTPIVFFRLDTRWRGRKEEKAISYHNTLLIANCDAET